VYCPKAGGEVMRKMREFLQKITPKVFASRAQETKGWFQFQGRSIRLVRFLRLEINRIAIMGRGR
jgi:hypothetical protein